MTTSNRPDLHEWSSVAVRRRDEIRLCTHIIGRSKGSLPRLRPITLQQVREMHTDNFMTKFSQCVIFS